MKFANTGFHFKAFAKVHANCYEISGWEGGVTIGAKYKLAGLREGTN